MKLTKADKVRMVKNLSPSQKATLRRHMGNGTMSGAGFLDFLKKIGNTLAPVVKAVGMPVLKEILIPLAKSKMGLGMKKKGAGLKPSGGGLRLAGVRSSRTKKLTY